MGVIVHLTFRSTINHSVKTTNFNSTERHFVERNRNDEKLEMDGIRHTVMTSPTL